MREVANQPVPITDSGQAKPELIVYVVIGLIAITALCMSLSQLQHYQTADAVVPVLASLQHWTPFFWETNRYGMLVPLLAWPFRNPMANLIVQTALTIFAGLAASFLLVRYLFGRTRHWLLAAALQNIWLLLLVPKPMQFEWFVAQCYAVSFSLSFLSLIFLREKKTFVALVLMVLAAWVNSAAFILLVPLVVLYHLAVRMKEGLFSSLTVIVASAGAGIVMMSRSRFANTDSTLLPPSLWASARQQLINRAHENLAPRPELLLWIIVPAALGVALLVVSRSNKRPLLISLALVGTAVAYFLSMATLTWVRLNVHSPRYIFPALLVLSTAMAILVVAPFEGRLFYTKWIPAAAAAAMLVSALIAYGRPSVRIVRAEIDENFGSMTNDILASRAELITGNYWKVWPAVLHANLVLYERGEHRAIYGATYRGSGTSRLWIHDHGICVAAPVHDTDAANYIRDTDATFSTKNPLPLLKNSASTEPRFAGTVPQLCLINLLPMSVHSGGCQAKNLSASRGGIVPGLRTNKKFDLNTVDNPR